MSAERQDRQYRWFPADAHEANPTQPYRQPGASVDRRVESRVARIASYYLDVLAHDNSYDAAVFARSRSEAQFLELPCFPPPAMAPGLGRATHQPDAEFCSQINRFISAGRKTGSRKTLAVGYPVFAQRAKGRSGWQGFLLKPLFIFDVNSDEPGALQLVDAHFPIVNRAVLEALTGVSGSALMEELLSLMHELGLSDSQEIPEFDELFLRLRRVRPEWPWREELQPERTSAEWPLSDVNDDGFYNRSIMLYIERSPFTRGLEAELQILRKAANPGIHRTALATILGLSDTAVDGSPDTQQPLLEVASLNAEQRHAVESAMRRPLTVITGPPGTGKSQVVSQIVVNAVWKNQRVLVASKNNKAVDVVEYRVNGFSSQPGIFRLGPRELSQRLADYLSTLLSATVDNDDRHALATLKEQYQRQLDRLGEIIRQRDAVVRARNEVDRLSRAVDSARANLGPELFTRSVAADPDVIKAVLEHAIESVHKLHRQHQPWLTRLFWSMLRNARLSHACSALERLRPYLEDLQQDVQLPDVSEAVAAVLHRRLGALLSRVDDLSRSREYHLAVQSFRSLPSLEALAREEYDLQSHLHRVAAKLWSAWLQLLPERVDAEARVQLSQYAAVLKMLAAQDANGAGMSSLYRRFYQLSERASPHLSAWAVTSLSAKGRIPFQPGLFDLVVIDEASQCDIASALPLLYRARRAVIIGDPNQLRHISSVSVRLDHQLIMKHDLLDQLQLGYSVNSLYDLAAGSAGEGGVIALRDHHRSHAHIIQFSNQQFYGGTLRVATRYDRLKCVAPSEAAVQWEHVRGQTVRPDAGSAVNRDEAERVVQQVVRILNAPEFDGTVGVVTPFRGQANLINRLLNDRQIAAHRVSGTELLVDTVHKFQGDERDVIILSPVVSRNAPESALRFLELNKHLFNVAITRARATLIVVGDRLLANELEPVHVLRQFSEYLNTLQDQAALGAEAVPLQTESAVYPSVSRPELVSAWERRFYASLRQAGLKPIPQYPVDQFLLDFALFDGERKLAVEVDGETFHRDWDGELVVRDRLRTMRLGELGWDVMRFWVFELQDYEPDCVRRVAQWVESAESEPPAC